MKKRYDRLLLLTLLGAYSLITFVIRPVWLNILSNIVYIDTLVFELLGSAMGIIRMLADFFAYAVIFYCAYRFTLKKTKNQIIIVFCALVFSCVSNAVLLLAFEGEVGVIDYWRYLLLYIAYVGLLPFVLDLLLYGLILGGGLYIINKNASKECLPIRSVFSYSNPLQRAIGWGALVLSASKIIERIVYDIRLGAPEGIKEALEMVVYYFTDILIGAVAYFVMLGLVSLFYSRDKKEKADA